MVLVWESYKLDPYVQKLAEAVFNFQEKVLLTAAYHIHVHVTLRDLFYDFSFSLAWNF